LYKRFNQHVSLLATMCSWFLMDKRLTNIYVKP